MATVDSSVPEDVRGASSAESEGQDKSAIIAGLMREENRIQGIAIDPT